MRERVLVMLAIVGMVAVAAARARPRPAPRRPAARHTAARGTAPLGVEPAERGVEPTERSGRWAVLFARAVDSMRRRRTIAPDVVAQWCDDLAMRVRAGSSLSVALGESIPDSDAIRFATDPIRLALARGRPVADAVSVSPHGAAPITTPGHHHLALACSVIAVSARVGGSPTAPLDRVASSLRLRAVDGQERATNAAQARMSARVLTVVPLAVLALLVVTDPDVRATLAAPIGALCVAFGLGLNLAGWAWMRRTIGSSR